MPSLSWRHHTLIQSLLSRGPLKKNDFLYIFTHITKNSGSTQQQKQKLLNEYLQKINEELSYVQFELRACRNQYDGNIYYGVVNNVPDEQSKLGTRYTLPQIAFYKGVVEAIIQDTEVKGSISNTDALYVRLEMQIQGVTDSQSQASSQVPPALKNFSMTQKEKTLEQLVKDQWLCSTPDGNIGLGVRTFLDLRSWFRTNEVPACEACNEAAVKAQICQNKDCNVRLHQYCLKNKFSQKGVERVCPGCGTEWCGSVVKGEALVVEEEDDPGVPSQSQQLPQPSMKKRLKLHKEEADTETTGSDSCQASLSNAKRVTRRSTRLHVN